MIQIVLPASSSALPWMFGRRDGQHAQPPPQVCTSFLFFPQCSCGTSETHTFLQASGDYRTAHLMMIIMMLTVLLLDLFLLKTHKAKKTPQEPFLAKPSPHTPPHTHTPRDMTTPSGIRDTPNFALSIWNRTDNPETPTPNGQWTWISPAFKLQPLNCCSLRPLLLQSNIHTHTHIYKLIGGWIFNICDLYTYPAQV